MLWTPCLVVEERLSVSLFARPGKGLHQVPRVAHHFSPRPFCARKQERWAKSVFSSIPTLATQRSEWLSRDIQGPLAGSLPAWDVYWVLLGKDREKFLEEKLLAQSLRTIRKNFKSLFSDVSLWGSAIPTQQMAPSAWQFHLWFCSFLVLKERERGRKRGICVWFGDGARTH